MASGELFLLGASPERLYKFDLDLKSLIEGKPMCADAKTFLVDETNNQIYVPCFKDNQII